MVAAVFTSKQLSFCTDLPKIELHAHLNGSIRDCTLSELATKHQLEPETVKLAGKGTRTLPECFKLFDAIHRVTTDHDIISRIAQEVVEDFANDNVIYLELRTTPKNRPEYGMTKRSYVEAVLKGLRAHQKIARESPGAKQLMVLLLLSIDRREGAQEAMATVELAADLRPQGVVGIDLSGNPSVGSWSTWEPALVRARELGLKLTVHAGEVYMPEETAAILKLGPDRLGHMCFLDDSLEQALMASKIPLELCLSSNILTNSVSSFPDHHFLPFFTAGHPVVLCTDDSGVFGTTLSKEYAIAAAAFGLDEPALLTLAESAVEHCFVEASEKEVLRSRFEGFRMCNPDIGSQKLNSIPLEPVLDDLKP